MTDRISLGTLWEETAAFVRAEAPLLLPVAFAGFGLPMILLELAVPERVVVDGQVAAGPWMWGLIPYALVSAMASVALSALALVPGISVGQAIVRAARALPAAAALLALAVVALGLLSAAASVFAGIEQATRGAPGPVFVVALLCCFVAVIWVVVRALPVWALFAEAPSRPVAVLKRAFAITRRAYILLLLLRIVAWVAQIVTILVVLMPIAVVMSLIGVAAGAKATAEVLTLVAGGGVVSAVMMVWTVYVARLSRRLGGATNGI